LEILVGERGRHHYKLRFSNCLVFEILGFFIPRLSLVKNMSCYRLFFWKSAKSYKIVQKKLKGHSSKKVTFIVLKFRPAFFHICMQLLSFQILDIMNEGSDFGMSTIIEHVMRGVEYLSLLTSIYHISWNERCLRGPPASAAAPQVRTGPGIWYPSPPRLMTSPPSLMTRQPSIMTTEPHS
jgi:hypothetical protein